MYSNFIVENKTQYSEQQLSFQKCIIGGNWAMIVSFLVASVCLLVTFQFEQHFSIVTQIAAHISTIIFAALFKVGYVVRCVGVHGLGFKVF